MLFAVQKGKKRELPVQADRQTDRFSPWMIKRLRRLIPGIKQSKHTSEKPVGTSQSTDHTEAVLMKPVDMF